MMNIMEINGYKAIIKYDPVIDNFRGEFVTLNGGADFYASNIKDLHQEGKFNLRVTPELHAEVAAKAAAEGKSLNQCVADMLKEIVHIH